MSSSTQERSFSKLVLHNNTPLTLQNASSSGKSVVDVSGLTSTRTLTVPDGTGTLVLDGLAQTLSNKTIVANTNTLRASTIGPTITGAISVASGATSVKGDILTIDTNATSASWMPPTSANTAMFYSSTVQVPTSNWDNTFHSVSFNWGIAENNGAGYGPGGSHWTMSNSGTAFGSTSLASATTFTTDTAGWFMIHYDISIFAAGESLDSETTVQSLMMLNTNIIRKSSAIVSMPINSHQQHLSATFIQDLAAGDTLTLWWCSDAASSSQVRIGGAPSTSAANGSIARNLAGTSMSVGGQSFTNTDPADITACVIFTLLSKT